MPVKNTGWVSINTDVNNQSLLKVNTNLKQLLCRVWGKCINKKKKITHKTVIIQALHVLYCCTSRILSYTYSVHAVEKFLQCYLDSKKPFSKHMQFFVSNFLPMHTVVSYVKTMHFLLSSNAYSCLISENRNCRKYLHIHQWVFWIVPCWQICWIYFWGYE